MFIFSTCILPDNMAHDISKEFWKNIHSENMTAGFLLRCWNSLRWEISLICHWNIDSLNQDWSFVHVIVPNNDQYICHLDAIHTTLSDYNSYNRGNIGEIFFFHPWKCIISRVVYWTMKVLTPQKKTSCHILKIAIFQNSLLTSWAT